MLEIVSILQIYPVDEIKRAKLSLLASTAMVDFVDDIQKSLGMPSDPEGM